MFPLTAPLAFAAGLLSFISPCVLPLVPVYLGYLSGSSISDATLPERRQVLGHALFFVGGFTLVFLLLFGLPTMFLGRALDAHKVWVARVGGLLMIVFGLYTLGVLNLPLLNVVRRLELGGTADRAFGDASYLRSILIGVTFAAGWTPCIGPLLSTVIMLAFTEPSRAIGYTFTYALGLAIPFLLVAVFLTRAVGWLRRLRHHLRLVQVASGLLLVGTGTLLVSGAFALLNSYLIGVTPEWLFRYL